jgi:hypothetical protein
MPTERNRILIAETPEEIPFHLKGLAEVLTGDRTICLVRHRGQLHSVARKNPLN